MQVVTVRGSVTEALCDVLIVNLFEGVKRPGGATGAVDQALGGAISALIEREGFEGKLGETLDLTTGGAIGASRVIIVGLGKADAFDADAIRKASAVAARRARNLSARRVASIIHGAGIGGIDPALASRATTLGTLLGLYKFTRLKTDKPTREVEEFAIIEKDESKLAAIEAGMRIGKTVADAVSFARDLTNEPANVVTPGYLAETARTIAGEFGMECRVFEREEIAELGMGLLTAVARASAEPPKFIRLEYKSPNATRRIAVIGKGVTFDSGGLNLKPGDSMAAMKDDMGGAAAVLAAMRAVGELKPEVNVLALVPATENMIGGNATHVGDVIRALSGKTVEIDNTDAEGRLILSDAATYAESEGVDEIIDVATLTGACVVALGRGMAGVLGSDQGIVERLIKAGAKDGEKLWQLPLHTDYLDNLKSETADMKNAGSREGGAIIGALFIKNHIKGTPWAHIDVAGPVTLDRESALSTKGSTGFGTATLVNYLLGNS